MNDTDDGDIYYLSQTQVDRYFQTLNTTQCIEGNSYKYAYFKNNDKFFKFKVEKNGPAVITLNQHTAAYDTYPSARMMLFRTKNDELDCEDLTYIGTSFGH